METLKQNPPHFSWHNNQKIPEVLFSTTCHLKLKQCNEKKDILSEKTLSVIPTYPTTILNYHSIICRAYILHIK